jgi:hypothetical protein
MKYVIIKLTNGELVKIRADETMAICVASTNNADELFIERQLYSGTEDNTALTEQQMWRDIQEGEREQ